MAIVVAELASAMDATPPKGQRQDATLPARRSLAVMVQRKLIVRTKYLSVLVLPMLAVYILARTSALAESYHTIAVSVPYILGVCFAAWLPRGMPPSTAPLVTLVMAIFAAVDGNVAAQQWQTDYTPRVRLLRTLIPGCFSLGNMLLALDVLLYRARRWWLGLRLVLTVCCTIRLGAVVMLRELGAPPNSFPPGSMSFTSSVWYNLVAIALATVGFSPSARQYLSELTGASSVVLLLSDVSELPAGEGKPWGLCEAAEVPAPRATRAPSHASGNAPRSDGGSSRSGNRSRISSRSGRSGGSGRSRRGMLLLSRPAWPRGAGGTPAGLMGAQATSLSILGAQQQRPLIHKRRWQRRQITMYPEDFAAREGPPSSSV